MSGKYYMLVNPYVEGNISKVFKAENSLKAAKMTYENLSKYFNNSVKNFKFTLLKIKSDSINTNKHQLNEFNLHQYGGDSLHKFNSQNFSHFVVNEKINNNEVKYMINKLDVNLDNNAIKILTSKIYDIQNKYGKHNLNQSISSETLTSSTNSSDSSLDTTENNTSSINNQKGGKHKKNKYDDSDDSSDDSPDYRVRPNVLDPINYWYYNPLFYPYINDEMLWLPNFVSPLSFPYIFDLNKSLLKASVNLT